MTGSAGFWVELLWGVIGLGLVIYAVTGGADLGVGVWQLLASGPRKEEQRRALRDAIAPIWEANHVWLIFVIVVLFTAFPRAFSVVSIALHIPIALALLGVVFRGSAYTFRAYGIQGDRARKDWDRVFAWASVLAPFCWGLVIGGVSSGEIRLRDGQVVTGFFAGWTSPLAFTVGAFSLSLFAMLSAVYLAADTRDALSDDFRSRALVMEVVSGAFALLTFVVTRFQSPTLYENLAGSPFTWPIQTATAVLAFVTIGALVTKRLQWARYSAAAQVALVVLGWGLAMRGYFVLPDLSAEAAAAHPEVLPTLAALLGAGTLVLAPALVYLYWVFKRSAP